MQIHDSIYGTFTITEPVLIELINSKPMQRLKGIAQYGLPPEYYHHQGYSRYDHCLGVMLLLRKLGAPLQEQVAGLLHDVSHTAFSHIIDWVLGDRKKEDYQDQNHEKYIRSTEIPAILEKYGFDVAVIFDEHKYPLLEQPAPNLCADRVDYALREFLDWAAPEIVSYCLKALMVQDYKMVFSSQDAAEKFSRTYLKCQTEHWGDAETVIRYSLLADALKRALEIKVISLEDLYQDDQHVLQKMKSSNNPQILKNLNLLSEQIRYKEDMVNPQYSTHKKFRYVDPEFLEPETGTLQRLSTRSPEYALILEQHRKINEQGINVSLLP